MMQQHLNRFMRLIPLIAALCIAIEIVMTNSFVTSGKQVGALDLAIDELHRQNERLEQQVASASSLIAVGDKAASLGFVTPAPSQVLSLGSEHLPVALK